ncbi:MAG: type II toxin-antitoxin system VapC family toxin [Rhodospirillaceae bacterium]|nr:type II toxin-antitoxin system VapC family toxin [Rhodospirillaceae bacterium]
MRLLLDTNQILFIANDPARLSPRARDLLWARTTELFMSSVSLWEIDLKHRAPTRSGGSRLPLRAPLTAIVGYLLRKGVQSLGLEPRHVIAELTPGLAHNDPFDLMLLKQAQLEGLKLLTSDRALARHPLAIAA